LQGLGPVDMTVSGVRVSTDSQSGQSVVKGKEKKKKKEKKP